MRVRHVVLPEIWLGGHVVGGYGGGTGAAARGSRGAGGYVRHDGVVEECIAVDGSIAVGTSGQRIADADATADAADARLAPQDVRRVVADRTAARVHDDGAANAIHGLGALLVNAALSLLFGMSVSVFLTRRDVLMEDFVSAPLLDGESVLVEQR